METIPLFDSGGRWIAYQAGNYVFNTRGESIGWRPWDDDEVITPEGHYLGHTFPNNRFYRRVSGSFRKHREYPGDPGYVVVPSHPEHAGYSPKPSDALDIDPDELAA